MPRVAYVGQLRKQPLPLGAVGRCACCREPDLARRRAPTAARAAGTGAERSSAPGRSIAGPLAVAATLALGRATVRGQRRRRAGIRKVALGNAGPVALAAPDAPVALASAAALVATSASASRGFQHKVVARSLPEDSPLPPATPAPTRQQSLEMRLWVAWKGCARPRPGVKEIRECLAFHRATRELLGRRALVVDAAGGHGAVALAFCAGGQALRGVVADIRTSQSFENLREAWTPLATEGPRADWRVCHVPVDLRDPTWLRGVLATHQVSSEDVAVVACHSCSVLADQLIQTCLEAEVSFALMPCCHGERGARGDTIKDGARQLGVPVDTAYDLMRLGAIDAAPGYVARLRSIDASITPKNRILLGIRGSIDELEKRRAQRTKQLDTLAEKWLEQGEISLRQSRRVRL